MQSLEREEEFIINMLSKKLTTLNKDKIELESTIEQEQEFLINNMSRQMAQAITEKL
jgi:hypothetical protein